jgi:hypothetical protein
LFWLASVRASPVISSCANAAIDFFEAYQSISVRTAMLLVRLLSRIESRWSAIINNIPAVLIFSAASILLAFLYVCSFSVLLQ